MHGTYWTLQFLWKFWWQTTFPLMERFSIKKKLKKEENVNAQLPVAIQMHIKWVFGLRFVRGVCTSASSPFFFMHADYTGSRALCTIQALFKRHYALFSRSHALFTHLKIILLQYFQFSVFSKISDIQTDHKSHV